MTTAGSGTTNTVTDSGRGRFHRQHRLDRYLCRRHHRRQSGPRHERHRHLDHRRRHRRHLWRRHQCPQRHAQDWSLQQLADRNDPHPGQQHRQYQRRFNLNGFTQTLASVAVSGTGTQNGILAITNSSTLTVTGSTSLSSGTLGLTTSGTYSITFGNITLNTGGTFAPSSTSLNVTGNWTNNGGTFTPSTSTVTFDGTSARPSAAPPRASPLPASASTIAVRPSASAAAPPL